MRKIDDTSCRPTSLWCIKSGMTCCLSWSPMMTGDTPKEFRYTCTVCAKHHPNLQKVWKAGYNQVNLCVKHCAGKRHFKAFLTEYPLTDQDKSKRILEVLPAIRTLMQQLTPKWGGNPKFNEADLQALSIKALTNPSVAYWDAYCFGIGSSSGDRGAGITPTVPKTGSAPPVNNTYGATTYPFHVQPPAMPPETAPIMEPPAVSVPVPMQHPPPLTLRGDIHQMYHRAEDRSNNFMEKQNKSA